MKTLKLSLALLAAAVLSAFLLKKSPGQDEARALIQARYQDQLAEFTAGIDQLEQAVLSADTGRQFQQALEQAFRECRRRYKQVEYLAAYLDAEFIRDFVNGPPLPALERNTGQLSVLEPEGLQVIDEIVFGGEAVSQRDELLLLIRSLQSHVRRFARFQASAVLNDRQIFEAIRQQVIRVFTLGVTGFDTPASGNAMPEAFTAMTALDEALRCYDSQLQAADAKLAAELRGLSASCLSYLRKNQDFDRFDRLEFLRQFINPLYKLTLDAQLALNIETIYDATVIPQAVNYFSDNVFKPDFLNAHYYAKLEQAEYNDTMLKLGRLLFFDPVLSGSNDRACASCHKPELAFTDGRAKSTAFNFQGSVKRNSPTLINAIFADRFFYDLRVKVLEDQIEHVITSEEEFHTSFKEVFRKLNSSGEYRRLFTEAFPGFGGKPINRHTLSTALAAYLRSLVGFNSAFDRYVRGESASLPPAAHRGFNLFMGKAVCGTCHFAPTFSGLVPPLYSENESEVLGVPANTDTLQPLLDSDMGRIHGIIRESAEFYRRSFKTTTVRNVALTAPYMHNGVYNTLEEVVEFYNRGGGGGLGLEVPNQTLPFDALHLNRQEQEDIIAFMRALTDTSGMTGAPRYLPLFEDDPSLGNRKIGGEY